MFHVLDLTLQHKVSSGPAISSASVTKILIYNRGDVPNGDFTALSGKFRGSSFGE